MDDGRVAMAGSSAMSGVVGRDFSVFSPGSLMATPLSPDERRSLVRILGLICDERYPLNDRRRDALGHYLKVVTSPPLEPNAVVDAARELVEIWADAPSTRGLSSTRPRAANPNSVVVEPASPLDIGVARVRRAEPVIQALPRRRAQPIIAELLELENTNASTQPMSPTAIADVLRAYSP